MSVDEVARAKIESHEARCDERHSELRARLGRMEKVLISLAVGVILTLLNVVFKVI